MAREDLHFRLRIPEYLKDLVERAAAEHEQSMTAEIIQRLHISFDEGHLTLKIPDDLRDKVKDAADENMRSLNAEIVFRLEAYEEREKANRLRNFFDESGNRRVKELERQNEALQARLTRLYQDADARFDDFSPNQLSTIKRIANDQAHLQTQLALARLEAHDPTGTIKAERERLEAEQQERTAQK